jgi:predicted aconitase
MTDLSNVTIELTVDEREVLRGHRGPTLQKFMETVVRSAGASTSPRQRP